MTAKPVVTSFTGLTDTPASITADTFLRGNSGGTALEHANGPAANNTVSWGTESVRFDKFWGRMGIFLGGDGVVDASFQGGATGPNHGGIIAGSQNLTGTMVHDMDSANTAFPAVALIGNTYNADASSTAIFRNTGGGAVQFGSSYTTYGGITSTIRTTAFGAFTTGYAWAYGSNSSIINEASGAFCGGYPATSASGGGTATVRVFNTGQGAFCWGRTPYSTGGAGNRQIYARGAGSFVLGVNENTGSGVCLIQSNNNSKGSFVCGYVQGNGTSQAQLRTGNNDSGCFAQGAVRAVGELARLEASQDGAFAQGYVLDSIITVTGRGAFGQGNAGSSNNITSSGSGSFAQGDSNAGAITASATNAVQFGPGTNSTADSLQVGAGFRALATGQHAGSFDSLTLAAAATTFAATSNTMVITGDAGTNTIATITGGINGQFLCLLFTDGNVTITDDNTHVANSVDLSTAFTSADDTVLTLVYDGTSWYEVSRSVN